MIRRFLRILMLKQYSDLPRAVHVLCIGTLINRCGMFLLVFLTIYVKDELQFTMEAAGLVMGAFGVGSFAAGFIGGALADRIGRRPVMLISMLGSPPLIVLFGQMRTVSGLMCAAMGLALVAEMYRPATQAMIADIVDESRRPHAFGLMYLAINVGAAIAPPVGGLVAEYSFALLFWGDAITTGVYGVIIFALIKETRPSQDAKLHRGPTTSRQPGWRTIASDRTFLVFCAAVFALSLVYMQAFSSFALYATQQGLSKQEYGWVIAVNGTMIVLLQIAVTDWIRPYARGKVLIVAALIQGIGFGWIGLASGMAMLALAVAIFTIAEMMQAPIMPAIVSDLAPVELRGRYMGAFSVCFAGANVLGAPIGLWTLSRLGGATLWGITVVLCVVGALLLASIHRRIGVPGN
jgi:MFS family permease